LKKQEAAIRDQICRSEDRSSQEEGDDGHHPATSIPLAMKKKKQWISGQIIFKREGMMEEAPTPIL